MRIFQSLWGYSLLVSMDKLISELVTFVAGLELKYLFVALIILSLLVVRIRPDQNSNYPLAFRMEVRNLGLR